MSETTSRDLTYSVTDGKLETIRGTRVPEGTLAAPGVESVSQTGRQVTQRALAMTEGLFHFAERSHQKDPKPPQARVLRAGKKKCLVSRICG
jgi:hypothetical protein